jgi:hypothetical protein
MTDIANAVPAPIVMAAFFAINFEEFPKNSDGSSHLTLGWVSKYLCTYLSTFAVTKSSC